MKKSAFLSVLTLAFIISCSSPDPSGCFPKEKLPGNIEPLTSFGQRAEWSLDGREIFYIDSAGGDVWKVSVKSKKLQKITKLEFRPEGHGYYRVMFLANGNLLLNCGPRRHETYMQIMDKSLEKPPITLDEDINEGAAITRNDNKIAWTKRQEKIWTGEIVYEDGVPMIINRKLIIDNDSVEVDGVKYEGIIEPQSFRPPENKELIWSQYGTDDYGRFTSEVFGYDLETGELTNYSKAPNQYDEPEGIFPGGEYTLTECDRHNSKGTSHIDIYKLKLDGTARDYERITFFNDVEGYRSSNPAISDDGKYMAFQASRSGTAAGYGCGIYLMKLK